MRSKKSFIHETNASPEVQTFRDAGRSFVESHIISEAVTPQKRQRELKQFLWRICSKLKNASSTEEILYFNSLITLACSASISKDGVAALGLVQKMLDNYEASNDDEDE